MNLGGPPAQLETCERIRAAATAMSSRLICSNTQLEVLFHSLKALGKELLRPNVDSDASS